MPHKAAAIKPATAPAPKLISFPAPALIPGHDAPELLTDGGLVELCLPSRVQDRLDNLFAEWDALDEQIRAFKAEQAERATELGKLIDSRGLKAIACNSLSVRWVYSHSSSINKLRLLDNGVSADVIAASTKQKSFRRLAVTNPAKAAERKAEREAAGGEEEGAE